MPDVPGEGVQFMAASSSAGNSLPHSGLRLALIQPRISPLRCGIGDHGRHLAEVLRAQHGMEVVFGVFDPQHKSTSPSVEGAVVLRDRTTDSIRAWVHALQAQGARDLFINYSQYDYHPAAVPRWLLQVIREWRRSVPRATTTIFVHEFWLPGFARRREWWRYPLQLAVHRRLFQSCDRLITNTGAHLRRLEFFRLGRPIELWPVSSNWGEDLPTTGAPRQGWVIAGSGDRIARSLRSFVLAQTELPAVGTTRELTLLGGESHPEVDRLASSLQGWKITRRTSVSRDEAARILGAAAWGWLDYEDVERDSTNLFKSSVLMACLAHGVLPVVPRLSQSPALVGRKIPFLARNAAELSSVMDNCAPVRAANRDWYVSCASNAANAARFFAKPLWPHLYPAATSAS